MKNVLSYLLLVFASKCHLGKASCTDEDISRCAQPLAAFNLSDAPIVPTRSESEMTNLCRAYDLVEECLGEIEHDCDNSERLKMKTVDLQYDYICDKTFDEYLKHRECLAKPDLHKDAGKCNDSLTRDLNSLDNSTRSRDYRIRRLCQYANQYISCIFNTVRGYCHASAAEWQRGLDILTVLPAFSKYNCEIFHPSHKIAQAAPQYVDTGGNQTTMIVVAVIVVGVACLILVGGMTAFFIHRKRKADRKRAADEILHLTRRNPRSSRATRPNENRQDNTLEGAEAAAPPPSAEYVAPPPYLEKEVPPPSYRNPPNYDALFAESAGAMGMSVNDEIPSKDKL